MFEAIFTIIGALCTFFYLEYKQIFGDDNEK